MNTTSISRPIQKSARTFRIKDPGSAITHFIGMIFAMAGAALAVGLKAKKVSNKSVGVSASITALLAATEPALYGVLIPLKRPLIAACGAAGVAGIVIGLLGVHSYSMGSFNLFTLSFTIGGDSMMNFYMACGCAALAFALGFVFTWLLGFKED